MRQTYIICGVAFSAALALAPAAWAAGPCTDDIAQLGKQLGTMNGLGAPVSEPDNGQQVGKDGAKQADSSASDRKQGGGASLVGGGSPGTVGGVAGGAGGQAKDPVASGQVATSAADVRRQSAGKPTMAQQAAMDNGKGSSGASMASEDKVSQAKAALQRAVDQNAKGDGACAGSIKEARALMPQH
jgi:hypothetical protein